MKLILIFILTAVSRVMFAQSPLSEYLSTHHYAFTLEGFDKRTSDTLQEKLSPYRVVLQAEGGSHFLSFYHALPLLWIKFLHERFSMTNFFLEGGHTADILLNKYLATGDTSYIFVQDKVFWKSLYNYNATLPTGTQLRFFGIDFESERIYIKGLKTLLPAGEPPEKIRLAINLIKNADTALVNCDDIVRMNKQLKKALEANPVLFKEYFGDKYRDFENVVMNEGSCKDKYKNRNDHMASAFLAANKYLDNHMYYGELGQAHTVLTNKNTASIINSDPGFENKYA